MSFKTTKVWKWAQKKKNNHFKAAHYHRALKLKQFEYEEYLVNRYREMMNRRSYCSGSELNFENPVTFTEKCQWIKLYDQDPRKPIYSDKYAVREHIKNLIGEGYLVPLISIDGKDHFYNAKEIDFSKLPNRFVLKCNHGSHMNILVEDKSSLSKKQIRKYKKQLNKWLKTDYVFYVALETQYVGIKPCIIIEQFLDGADDMREFKFTYFNGELAFFWISERVVGSFRNTTTFLNNQKTAPFNFDLGIDKPVDNPSIPQGFNKLKDLADKLCDNFTMVRVDLMLVDGKIYFSELTFNSAAGFDAPRPIEYNKIIGDMLRLDLSKRENNYTYRKKQ